MLRQTTPRRLLGKTAGSATRSLTGCLGIRGQVYADESHPTNLQGFCTNDGSVKVYWLIPAYALFTLAFGGTIVPKLNLYVWQQI